MDKITKDTYIEDLQTFSSSKDFVEATTNFIESYDGTNGMEFEIFELNLMKILNKFEEYKLKAESFDKVATILGKKTELEDLKAAYEQIKETGSMNLPVSSPKNS